jgi:signal transduction histidine kinase
MTRTFLNNFRSNRPAKRHPDPPGRAGYDKQTHYDLAEALVAAAAAINSSLDLEEVLDQILEQVLRVANCRSASILLLDTDNQSAFLARRCGYQNTKIQQGSRVSMSLQTLQTMYSTKKSLLLADTHKDTRWTLLPGTQQTRSYAGAPLLIDQQVVGFLNLNSDEAGFFNGDTTRRLEAFAAHAALAINNARIYHKMQQYANQLEDRVRERTAELQAAKEYIEGILACVPDAVLVLDNQSNLVRANQAGAALLDWSRQHGLDLLSEDVIERVAGSSDLPDQNIFDIQDRAYQALASNLSIDCQPAGKILVFRDVTRFREIDKMKTKFVSDVSHELRTPLTNMTIYLDLLESVNKPDKRDNYLEILKRETGRLTHLIENLLTISRLEAGRLEIYIKPVNVNRLISELVSDRSAMAGDRGLTLECHPATGLPPGMADPRLLNQAISNLLTNAINYTLPEGRIQLRSGIATENGQEWITISVQDSGVGIPSSEIDTIFERFFRGSASDQTNAAGTGLGLPISKELVERMGGHITVESTPGKGSTFTVWLRAML